MSSRYALKFLARGARGPYSKFSWPVPNGKPGTWVRAKGNLVVCENGIHACTLEQSFEWLQDECYIIELGGKVLVESSKLVARSGRLVHRVESWNEKTTRLFAADCAEHVLPTFEKQRPKDDRPRKAIQATRDFAHGRIDDASRDAAWDAARVAAWDTARTAAGTAAGAAVWAASRDAAWDTARAAAWDAARTAAGVAAGAAVWDTARVAAGVAAGAAWDAAWDAERSWQTKRLARYLGKNVIASLSEFQS